MKQVDPADEVQNSRFSPERSLRRGDRDPGVARQRHIGLGLCELDPIVGVLDNGIGRDRERAVLAVNASKARIDDPLPAFDIHFQVGNTDRKTLRLGFELRPNHHKQQHAAGDHRQRVFH